MRQINYQEKWWDYTIRKHDSPYKLFTIGYPPAQIQSTKYVIYVCQIINDQESVNQENNNYIF